MGRLFRAFRVFRLFKRIPSLKLIIEGVLASLPGVMNAFLVLGILMGIWSIMGVEFFQFAKGKMGGGQAVGPECFGNFFKAMFTMWQVMSMDSWASGIARPILFADNYGNQTWAPAAPSGGSQAVSALFFISYTFIAGIIMTNVVVAILLEKYLDATSKVDADDEDVVSEPAQPAPSEQKETSAIAVADNAVSVVVDHGKRANLRSLTDEQLVKLIRSLTTHPLM